MSVGTFSRLTARIAPKRYLEVYRTAKTVLACRRRRFVVSGEPHLDEPGIAYFHEQLEHTRNYLEYGSGGSTICANRRVNILVSVDSDRNFLAAVQRVLAADAMARERRESRSGMTKLIYVNIGLTVEWGTPAFTRPTPRRVHRWEDYPSAPWRYLRSIDQQPDLILVDGRFRVACVLESLLSLSPSSDTRILLDDYISRPHYHVLDRFADVETVGRMAVLHPKQAWDGSEGHRLLEHYRTDYR
jgi:hypothetical protein